MKKQSKISLSSFISRKWTKHLNNLQSIVLSIRPNSISDWRRVCLKMHEIGSRKTYWQYKVTGDIILAKNQRIQIKLSREEIRNIFQRFGEGSSMPQLTQKYGTIITNIRRVRQMISKQLKIILLVMRWTVGRRNLRSIAVKDYLLFRFIRNRKLDLPNFNQVADHCQRYKTILKSKEEEHIRERYEISLYLNKFNSLLKAYSTIYEAENKTSKQRAENPTHQRVIDTPTIPCQHLALKLEQMLQDNKQESLQDNKMDIVWPTMTEFDIQMWSQDDFHSFSYEKRRNFFQNF